MPIVHTPAGARSHAPQGLDHTPYRLWLFNRKTDVLFDLNDHLRHLPTRHSTFRQAYDRAVDLRQRMGYAWAITHNGRLVVCGGISGEDVMHHGVR